MVGLLIALLWLGLGLVFGYSFPEAFLNAASFLFWWYTIITCLLFVICLCVTVFIGTTASQNLVGAFMGIILGTVVGTTLSVIALSKNLLFIIGSYLISASVVINYPETPVWNQTKLIVGSVILSICLVTTYTMKKIQK